MRVTAVQVEPGTFKVPTPVVSRGLCLALALVLLSGCAWMPFRHGGKQGKANDCNKPQLYEQAGSRPPLTIPVGLDALNTRGALRIPDLHEPEAPRKLSDACLDEPPKFSNARLMPPPRDKKAEKKLQAEQKAREKAKRADEKSKKSKDKSTTEAAPAPPAPVASPPATP
jgi:hypothetical protein